MYLMDSLLFKFELSVPLVVIVNTAKSIFGKKKKGIFSELLAYVLTTGNTTDGSKSENNFKSLNVNLHDDAIGLYPQQQGQKISGIPQPCQQ